ncbi:MAG: pilus assembly PilX N-terminal domain-containing protein [Phycisphaerae bacterium]
MARNRLLRTRARPGRRGIVTILALILITVFSSMAVVLAYQSDMNVRKAVNHADALSARLVAESGMAYTEFLMQGLQQQKCTATDPNMVDVVHAHLTDVLIPGFFADANSIVKDGNSIAVAYMNLPESGQKFKLDIDIRVDPTDPNMHLLDLGVTGKSGSLQRELGMTYKVQVNKTLLKFAMSSSVRVVARGNVRVHGPIASAWGRNPKEGVRNNKTHPLNLDLGPQGFIKGQLATTLSKEEFTGTDSKDVDFHEGIVWDDDVFEDPNYAGPAFSDQYDPNGGIRMNDPSYSGPIFTCDNARDNPNEALRSQIEYNVPEEAMTLDPGDFDMTPLRAKATGVLPPADLGNKWTNHDGTDGNSPAFNNLKVPKGTNPTFENCTFKGITFIEVDEDTDSPKNSNQNSVTFKNCTFEGPIITGCPKTLDWNKNRMDFEGDTIFKSEMIQAALGGVTLMAPNYNVNIGDCRGNSMDSDSTIRGLVLGGVVDLRDKVRVHGTVVSMAKLVDSDGNILMNQSASWLKGGSVSDSNLGYLQGGSEGGGDESNNDIDIFPDPDNVMPTGIKKKYNVVPVRTTYYEKK